MVKYILRGRESGGHGEKKEVSVSDGTYNTDHREVKRMLNW